jgi:hypothetical protein
MFEHARKHTHKFKAAFDCVWPEQNKVVKMFGSYASWEDFRDDLLEAKPENRHFYEIISPEEPSKLYLDVEWIGPADPERTRFRHLINELVAYIKVRCFPICTSAKAEVLGKSCLWAPFLFYFCPCTA